MSYNRIAVYGHRGWASSAIVNALISSGAPVKVLYRPGSDASGLPESVPRVEVDLDNQEQLVTALQDVDIVMQVPVTCVDPLSLSLTTTCSSLAGREGVPKQHAFVKAIPKTNVKLFVPSDLGFRPDEKGLRIPVPKTKDEVEKAAKAAGIPTTVVLVGCFAESGLATGLLGVDYAGNRIIFTGDSANQQLNICTRKYVAAAYASIFASTPPAQLAGRAIGLSELRATGYEIAAALKKKHGAEPQILRHSLEKADNEADKCIATGSLFSLHWDCRKAWGNGNFIKGVGEDFWEVKGYRKLTLDELLVDGKLEPYRDLPHALVAQLFATTFT